MNDWFEDDFIKRYSYDTFDSDLSSDMWIDAVISDLAPVVLVNKSTTEEAIFYIHQEDIRPFLYEELDKKIWVISNRLPMMFISFNELKEKFTNATILYIIMDKYLDELRGLDKVKPILKEYCKETGYFNILSETLKTGKCKYYKITDYTKWFESIENSVKEFYSNFNREPVTLIANHQTFEKIGFLGNYEFELDVKIFGKDQERELFNDIFPDLTFIFSEVVDDNQFILVYSDDDDDDSDDDIHSPINRLKVSLISDN